jgi:Na+-driven multidrug efflux pump
MGIMGVLFMTRGRQIVGVLSPQEVHLRITPTLLLITGSVQIPFAIGIVLRQAMRGAGDVKWVAALTWIGTYGARLPLAYLLSGADIPLPNGRVIHNPTGLTPSLPRMWIGLCSELVIRCLLFGARFVHGGWVKARV